MSENEKRLREWLATFCGRDASAQALADLDALLVEHLAEVSATRDAVLDEATTAGVRAVRGWMGGKGTGLACDTYVEQKMRALTSQPAERYLRESDVREVLDDARRALRECGPAGRSGAVTLGHIVRDRLGVDLDAEGAQDTRKTCTCAGQGTCAWCDEQVAQ